MDNKLPLIISFYTGNTSYEKEVPGFVKACKQFDLEHYVEVKEALDSWGKTCRLKAEFVLNQFLTRKRSLVWLDIDARVIKYPELFENIHTDIAMLVHEEFEDRDDDKVFTGTIFMNYTPGTEKLLRRWFDYCIQDIEQGFTEEKRSDQSCFRQAMLDCEGEFTITKLPYEYATIIYPQIKQDLADVVITHQQASRYYHRTLDLPLEMREQIQERWGDLNAGQMNLLLGMNIQELDDDEVNSVKLFLNHLDI